MRRSLVICLLLCVSLVLGDAVAGAWLSTSTANRLACRLDTDVVDVDVSGWPRSLPLLTGTLPRVQVSARHASLSEQLSGQVSLDLRHVKRTDDGLTSNGGTAKVTLPWSAVEQRLGRPGLALSGSEGAVIVAMHAGLVPLAVVTRPRVEANRMILDPVAVRIAGRDLTGDAAQRLLEQVGRQTGALTGVDLPTGSALSLQAARGEADGLTLSFDVPGGALASGLGQGSCSS